MRKIACLIVLFGLLAVPAFAQRTSGAIRGTVTDSSGAVIPGATVTAKSEGTGFNRSTVTNTEGVYSFEELPVGTYSVEVALQGFKTAVQTGIPLNVADVLAVNVQLQPGALAETITVESSTTTVKTVGGEVAGLVTGEQVRQLPLNGRNFLQLGTLMPGVSAGDGFNTKDRGLMSGIELAVSGSSLGGNMWMVDGANNNDVGSNRTILVFPSVDAIDEFKVHRNSYGAEFGGAAGAQVNIVTRSGTNQFHGSGYYFGRSDALASKDYFLEQADQPKAPLKVTRRRRDDRRADRQGQDAVLLLRGVEQGDARPDAVRVRADGGRADRRLQRRHDRGLLRDAGRSDDRRAVPRQQDPGKPAEPGGAAGDEALSAAERHAAARQLQQLGHRRHDADQLAPGERARRLHVQQQRAHAGPLHAGQLDERLAERGGEPVGRRPVPGGGFELEAARADR